MLDNSSRMRRQPYLSEKHENAPGGPRNKLQDSFAIINCSPYDIATIEFSSKSSLIAIYGELPMPICELNSQQFRQAMGKFVTGVTVVTTIDKNGRPQGLTVSSFNSVSLDPPLILWSLSLTAPSYAAFRHADSFAVSILAEDQAHVAQRFATGGIDKFHGVKVEAGLDDIPLISGAVAHIECAQRTHYPGGDHTVFMGEVRRISHSSRKPLVFGGSRYLVVNSHDGARLSEDDAIPDRQQHEAMRLAARNSNSRGRSGAVSRALKRASSLLFARSDPAPASEGGNTL